MSKKTEKALAAIFSGIGGIVLTLVFQYFLFPQSQSITVVVNGQEYYVTEDDYRTILDANEHFQSINENLRAEIVALQGENAKLQQEIDELRQANDTVNNGTGSNGTGSNGTGSNGTGSNGTGSNGTGSNGTGSNGTGSNGTGSSGTENNGSENSGAGSSDTGNSGTEDNGTEDNNNGIKGIVRLRNNANINGCPQVNIPEESQIMGQTIYTMTWNPFEGATTYRISMWKDANYGTADSKIIFVAEVEVSELSYTVDLTALELGYTYGFNVVVDNHFSSPLLIELY